MTKSSESEQKAKLHRRLVRYSFIIGITLSIATGTYLIQQDSSLEWSERLSGLGINLVASAVFATIFSLLVDRERESLISHKIDESITSHFDQFFIEWRQTHSLYMPNRHYPPTESFDKSFNSDLMKSIESSSTYFFQGVTAKYIPGRLIKVQHCPASIIVIIPHPTSSSAQRRVADRIKNPKYVGKSPETIATEMQDEILESLVGLFDYRHLASIEVIFSDETAVTRTELTDSAVFVTWYHGVESRGQAFAETLSFEPTSFYYQVARLRILRTGDLNRSDKAIRFNYNTTEKEARSALAALFNRRIKDIFIPDLRAAFQVRMDSFNNFLKDIGESK